MTAKPKLANAKDWRNRSLETWNTTTFHAYLADKHKELFGIDYAPFRGWTAEKGMIGDLIGTRNGKTRKASNETVKRFIDVTFENYKPSPQYPGVNFGWVLAFRKTDWQRIQAEEIAQKRREVSAEEAPSLQELDGWW